MFILLSEAATSLFRISVIAGGACISIAIGIDLFAPMMDAG